MNRNQIQQKWKNLSTLLHLIRREGQISQASLSQMTGFQPSTVSNLVRELKQKNLVEVSGKGESGQAGGKRSDLLSLQAGAGVFAGINLRQDSLLVIRSDFTGTQLSLDVRNLPEVGEQSVLEAVASELQKAGGHLGAAFSGAGIAVSSIVNNAGDIFVSSEFAWELHQFGKRLEEMVPACPLIIENDANCAALYSYHALGGAFRNILTFLIFPERTSIGSGVIIDGKLYRGTGGAAGEVLKRKGSAELTLDDITYYILSAASLLDTEVIVIAGEVRNREDEDFLHAVKDRLEREHSRFAVKYFADRDIAATGAAFLATQAYIERKLKEEGRIV